jgi:hypothetical protein
MSTARLILKQPTGWFAAGREVAQALAVLSMELSNCISISAYRQTGILARTMGSGRLQLPRLLLDYSDRNPAICRSIRSSLALSSEFHIAASPGKACCPP